MALVTTGLTALASGGVASAAPAPYKIGFLSSETGAYATALAGSLKGAQARIDLQNAEGGVNGHKLDLISVDDASSPTEIVTAVQNAVQNQGINILATTSYLTSVVAPYLHSQGMPVVGANYDGPEWGQQPNTNMFGNWGPMNPNDPTYTTYGKYFKMLGAKKLACVANNIPNGIADCNSTLNGSVYLGGMKKVYEDTTASLSQTTFTSIALGLKNSGATGVALQYGPQQNAALLLAMAKDSFKPKVLLMTASYGQTILSDPSLLQAVHETGAIIGSYFTPVQLNTTGTKAFQAALKKYDGITGTPSFQNYEGYTAATLAITALKAGGSHATKSAIIRGMQQISGVTLSGLSPSPLSWPLSKFGTGPVTIGANGCNYALRVVGSKFVPLTKTPVCGTQVPGTGKSTSTSS